VTGGWRKLHNERPHKFRVIEFKRMKLTRYVAHFERRVIFAFRWERHNERKDKTLTFVSV
jgi:hypothetical protein